jgi:urease accessory protein
MNGDQLARTLQIVDSMFPVGAFAYSDGLETAASAGEIQDVIALDAWLEHIARNSFVLCDGLAFLKCFCAAQNLDWETIRSIDEEVTALKPAGAARTSSKSVGKRFLTTYASLFEDAEVAQLLPSLPCSNAPVAYALALSRTGLEARDALFAFGYGRIAATVSAALRLLPIGQQQGQASLAKAVAQLSRSVDLVLANAEQPLRSFAPFMDIQQMNHQYVYSRLFRS